LKEGEEQALPRQFSKVFPRRPKKLATFCYTCICNFPPRSYLSLYTPRSSLLLLVNFGLISVAVPDQETEIVHESYSLLILPQHSQHTANENLTRLL